MLKQRILTAVVLIPIMLGLLFYLPPAAFCYLTGLIVLGCAWEWSNLMGLKRFFWRLMYLVIVMLAMISVAFMPFLFVFAGAFVWWLIASVLVIFYPSGRPWWGSSIGGRGLMGLLVLAPCWTAVNSIRSQDDGIYALLFLFVLIWGADSTAYFVGKKWGKSKLAPQVSPGKSWQGFLGALLFAGLFSLVALQLCQIPLAVWPWAVTLSLVTVLFSVMGDLFESMLKRNAGLKDSGQLLPGHGGLLDRIDSLTAAAPVFALGALLLSINLS